MSLHYLYTMLLHYTACSSRFRACRLCGGGRLLLFYGAIATFSLFGITSHLKNATNIGTGQKLPHSHQTNPRFKKFWGAWARICVANRGLGLPSLIFYKKPPTNASSNLFQFCVSSHELFGADTVENDFVEGVGAHGTDGDNFTVAKGHVTDAVACREDLL